MGIHIRKQMDMLPLQIKPTIILMRRVILILGFLITVSSTSYAGDTIPANDNLIEYTGRIDFADSLAPEFSYSGVSVRACFDGTSIAAILSDDQGDNYYNVILDGVIHDILEISTGEQTYILAEGLDDTVHEVELFKRTELTFGKTKFQGFIVDEGATLEPIGNTRELFIEYIGNSITCGYGNEGTLGESFGPTTENHFLTYAAISSRNFNARHMAVSRSGIGIYRNYGGPAGGNSDCMTNLYSRIFLYDEEPLYGFAVQPDVVCINLGTNDFSTTGGDSALYVSNYLRLIDTLQARYTNPEIVCLLGSMMSGETLSEVRTYLQFIADSAGNRGKGNVSFCEMSTQGAFGYGVDYHPTVPQHEKNAAELTDYLKSLMNWKIHPLIKKAETLAENHIRIEFNTAVYDPEDSYAGFSLYDEADAFAISQVYRDTNSQSLVHILLDENLTHEDIIYLAYTPGTIESQDSIGLARLNGFPIENTLTEPDLSDNKVIRNNGISVELFPNPCKGGVLQYSMNAGGESYRELKYEIIGVNGSLFHNGSLLNREGLIDLPPLENGVYYINFTRAGFRQTTSLVVAD